MDCAANYRGFDGAWDEGLGGGAAIA